jgi:NTP pyrophosphatase (non-canonical NTP hydrolase)
MKNEGCGYKQMLKDGGDERCLYGDIWRCTNGKPQEKIGICTYCKSGKEIKELTIDGWCKKITVWRMEKGFVTPEHIESIPARDKMLGKLMLVVTEIAEAAEAVRQADVLNFKEELADATIRIFDICGACDIDLELAIVNKMMENHERPYRHGKLTTL